MEANTPISVRLAASCQGVCVKAVRMEAAPMPKKENEHHAAPTPQIAQAPGGQRTQTEHEKRARAIRHQVLPLG